MCRIGRLGAPREAEALKDALPAEQLYDMSADQHEQHNVAADHPEVVKELTGLLKKYIADGRSTPGTAQTNDARIQIRKVPSVNAAAENQKGD